MSAVRPAQALEVPAAIEYAASVSSWLHTILAGTDLGPIDGDCLSEVELAIHEIWVNVVEHAYAGSADGVVHIDARNVAGGIEFQLRDQGIGFDPELVAEPDPEALQERGFGLFLVRRLMDEVTYEHTPEGNRWRLVKQC
jgi:serine/threonine-protein kinase RsbW